MPMVSLCLDIISEIALRIVQSRTFCSLGCIAHSLKTHQPQQCGMGMQDEGKMESSRVEVFLKKAAATGIGEGCKSDACWSRFVSSPGTGCMPAKCPPWGTQFRQSFGSTQGFKLSAIARLWCAQLHRCFTKLFTGQWQMAHPSIGACCKCRVPIAISLGL
jgi:hypothetical protein